MSPSSVGHCFCKPLPRNPHSTINRSQLERHHTHSMPAYFGHLPQAPSSTATSKNKGKWPQLHSGMRTTVILPTHCSPYFWTFCKCVLEQNESNLNCNVGAARIRSWQFQTGYPRNCNTLQGVGCSGWLVHDNMCSACVFAFCSLTASLFEPKNLTALPLLMDKLTPYISQAGKYFHPNIF